MTEGDMERNRQNDIDFFYEVIEQLEAKRILDIGMLLKRAGRVSMNLAGQDLTQEISLHGVDFFPEFQFPAWENIYQKRIDGSVFFEVKPEMRYDCAFLLGTEELEGRVSIPEAMERASVYSEYLLCDQIPAGFHRSEHRIRTLRIETDSYYLIADKDREAAREGLGRKVR